MFEVQPLNIVCWCLADEVMKHLMSVTTRSVMSLARHMYCPFLVLGLVKFCPALRNTWKMIFFQLHENQAFFASLKLIMTVTTGK